MLRLTDNLKFDENMPAAGQAPATARFIAGLLETPPLDVMGESCGGNLVRPLREAWEAGDCEILRLTSYNHPANHAACFASRNISIVVRAKNLTV